VTGRSDIFQPGRRVLRTPDRSQAISGATRAPTSAKRSSGPRSGPLRQIDDTIPREPRADLHQDAGQARVGPVLHSPATWPTTCTISARPGRASGSARDQPSSAVAQRPARSRRPSPLRSPPRDPTSDDLVIRSIPKGLRSFDRNDADFFLQLCPDPATREGLPESVRFWMTRIESTDSRTPPSRSG